MNDARTISRILCGLLLISTSGCQTTSSHCFTPIRFIRVPPADPQPGSSSSPDVAAPEPQARSDR